MRTQEEAILVAALEEDTAEMERLASGMLMGEILTLQDAMRRLNRTLDAAFWHKKRAVASFVAAIAEPEDA